MLVFLTQCCATCNPGSESAVYSIHCIFMSITPTHWGFCLKQLLCITILPLDLAYSTEEVLTPSFYSDENPFEFRHFWVFRIWVSRNQFKKHTGKHKILTLTMVNVTFDNRHQFLWQQLSPLNNPYQCICCRFQLTKDFYSCGTRAPVLITCMSAFQAHRFTENNFQSWYQLY